jgi:hydrogenase expression/formation protein HypC
MCLAVPGLVVEVDRTGDLLVGKVRFGSVSREVCLEHVPEVEAGDYVLVHVGFALSRIDAAEAERVFAFLAELGELEELGDST